MIKFLSTLVFLLSVFSCGNTSDSGRETPQAWHDYINEKLKEEHLRGK